MTPTPVLRSAKRALANVRRLNNISDVIFYCVVGERSRAFALLNTALLPSVCQWSCHYLFLRLRYVAAGIRTPNLSHASQIYALTHWATAEVHCVDRENELQSARTISVNRGNEMQSERTNHVNRENVL